MSEPARASTDSTPPFHSAVAPMQSPMTKMCFAINTMIKMCPEPCPTPPGTLCPANVGAPDPHARSSRQPITTLPYRLNYSQAPFSLFSHSPSQENTIDTHQSRVTLRLTNTTSGLGRGGVLLLPLCVTALSLLPVCVSSRSCARTAGRRVPSAARTADTRLSGSLASQPTRDKSSRRRRRGARRPAELRSSVGDGRCECAALDEDGP